MRKLFTLAERWRQNPVAFVEDVLTHPDGRSYGRHLDPWQREDLEAALTSGKHVWWERPRGHSKTQDLAAVCLTQLVLGPPGSRLYLAATDQAQAALAFDSIRGFVTRSPMLRQVVRLLRHEAAVEATDSVLTVLPADAPGSWGLRPSLVGLDEFEAWRGETHEEFFQALISALGKVPGARAIVALTAHWDRTSLAWQMRERVKDDPAWIFSRRGQCASWVRPEFLEQQRRILPEHVFKMLHENEWTTAGAAFLTWEEIDAAFDASLREQASGYRGYCCGVDLGTARDRTAVAVLHREPDGTCVVDTMALWSGRPGARVDLSEVEAAILDLSRRFRPFTVCLDPYQAILLGQRLKQQGITVEEYPFTQASRDRLFGILLQFIRNRKLKSYPHEALRQELAGLRWVEKAGVLRPDHAASGHDDLAVAVALALVRLSESSSTVAAVDPGTLAEANLMLARSNPWTFEAPAPLRPAAAEARPDSYTDWSGRVIIRPAWQQPWERAQWEKERAEAEGGSILDVLGAPDRPGWPR